MTKFDFTINAKSIGPHESLNAQCKFGTNKTVVFAQNGYGKTFISRMFRLCDQEVCDISKSEDLITKGKTNGQFAFSIVPQNEQPKSLTIDLAKGAKPNISNDTDYLFHVFNSDFTKDNLEACGYTPSGDIQGFVVSREAIDTQKEEARLKEIENERKELQKVLSENIEKAKAELKSIGISGNVAEYKNFTLDSIMAMDAPASTEYATTKGQYEKLKGMPDDINDFLFPSFDFNNLATGEIETLFVTSYDRAVFAEDFLSYVRKNTEFIKQGVELHDKERDTKCPFCRQSIGEEAERVIGDYEAYINDAEARIIESLKQVTQQCLGFGQKYRIFLRDATIEANRFDQIKQGFDSSKTIQLNTLPTEEEVNKRVANIVAISQEKQLDVSKEYSTNAVDEFEALLSEIEGAATENSTHMSNLNEEIKKIKKTSLAVTKKLCVERQNQARIDNDADLEAYKAKRSEYKTLKEDIRERKESSKASKKDLIGTTFEALLHYFFGDKYTFDTDNYCLYFKDFELTGKADRVLSDGEKTIIAFCYYVASIPKVVNEVEDYSRLFLIIDDPVSSMDFHYVYSVTQVIRKISKYARIPSEEHVRFLILTHNAEFLNILSRNRIVKNRLMLTCGGISPIKAFVIMPYEEHLKDVYDIAQNDKTPTHTIGNSIRHVLESLWRFERPDLDCLEKYYLELEELSENDYLYSLCQDLSHGAVRQEYPYDDALIKRSCSAVISMMEDRFSGQIKAIKETEPTTS